MSHPVPPDLLIAALDGLGALAFLLTVLYTLRVREAVKGLRGPPLLALAAVLGFLWALSSSLEWLGVASELTDLAGDFLLAAAVIALSYGIARMNRFE